MIMLIFWIIVRIRVRDKVRLSFTGKVMYIVLLNSSVRVGVGHEALWLVLGLCLHLGSGLGRG